MISVLFVAKNSVYKTLTDSSGEPLDCWDEERNALNWPGGNPVVAHPPCRLFCMLKHLSTAPIEEKQLAYWALDQVRQWGGVMEHPAGSTLWKERALPKPGQRDEWGFTFGLEQFWFGHLAQKRTWLYICGTQARDLPEIPMRFGYPKNLWSTHKNSMKRVRHSGIRNATPPAFAKWLVETAERCKSPESSLTGTSHLFHAGAK
jgi:hypothetical protein